MTKVAILGGGVAGLSAAHELVERGFEVDVYEGAGVFGGKARSFRVPGKNRPKGSAVLPAEHGFRFVPSFYRHLPDTLRRIPVETDKPSVQRRSVMDNLVPGARVLVAREEPPLDLVFNLRAQSADDLLSLAKFFGSLGLRPGEVALALRKLVELFTRLRADDALDLDDQTWWGFIEADGKSKEYQMYFGEAAVRWTVAMDPRKASARTIGRIALQFWRGTILSIVEGNDHAPVDRLFNGPTSEVWIEPWVDYLKSRQVRFHENHRMTGAACSDGRVVGIQVATVTGKKTKLKTLVVGKDFDYCVAALPLLPMLDVLKSDRVLTSTRLKKRYKTLHRLQDGDPSLQRLSRLRNSNESMLGFQFYLSKDVPVNRGGILFKDAPWALTGVSQTQFWQEKYRAIDYIDANGRKVQVKGVLSIILSSWNSVGDFQGRTARSCTPEQVQYELWSEIKAHLNDPDAEERADTAPLLEDKDLVDWHYQKWDAAKKQWRNDEPLFINKVGTYKDRPDAVTALSNFFLAADYVRTHTDLATMEGANEAARRAVNGVLRQSRSSATHCEIWPLDLSLGRAGFTALSNVASLVSSAGVNAVKQSTGLLQGVRSLWGSARIR
jgi:uncharacterized protein with NAD-binding domain and iron-sulfur cluster